MPQTALPAPPARARGAGGAGLGHGRAWGGAGAAAAAAGGRCEPLGPWVHLLAWCRRSGAWVGDYGSESRWETRLGVRGGGWRAHGGRGGDWGGGWAVTCVFCTWNAHTSCRCESGSGALRGLRPRKAAAWSGLGAGVPVGVGRRSGGGPSPHLCIVPIDAQPSLSCETTSILTRCCSRNAPKIEGQLATCRAHVKIMATTSFCCTKQVFWNCAHERSSAWRGLSVVHQGKNLQPWTPERQRAQQRRR